MAETAAEVSEERVKVGFAIELAVLPPQESDDFDPVRYCTEVLLDAMSGWGVGVTRIAHLPEPDAIFPE